MTLPFEFFDKRGYIAELTRSAKSAGPSDTLTLMAMAYDTSWPEIAGLAEALSDAAARGAKVRLIIDAMTFMMDDKERPGPLLLKGRIVPEQLRGTFKATYQSLEKLKASGGEYYILNQPPRALTLPYAGRSHIKLALVNDRIFIGGCNLDHPNYLDAVAAWHNQPTADAVNDIIEKIISDGVVCRALEYTDQTLVLGELMKIFIDCGVKRQSTILRQAHQLIDEAKEKVIITCQYFPGDETGRRLLAAHKRGVDVQIYFSHPTVHGKLALLHYGYNLFERLRVPAVLFQNRLPKTIPKLHAKALVTESAALIGSHNYVSAGVKFGTAEIALLNHDPTFRQQLEAHIQQLVSHH